MANKTESKKVSLSRSWDLLYFNGAEKPKKIILRESEFLNRFNIDVPKAYDSNFIAYLNSQVVEGHFQNHYGNTDLLY